MSKVAERLESLWKDEPGLIGWLATVDHKRIGKRYIVTALAFLVVGGLEAGLIRLQLARADQRLVSPEAYNQIFTLHGITMIFWYASPILSGFGNYLIPLLIGARDMAFPRLNAMSFWTFLLSGLFLYLCVPLGQAPHAGWFAYVPFSEEEFSPGLGMDFYALALIFLTISTTAGAINFIVTILRLRAPGMSLARMPLFLYSTLTVSVTIVFALPPLTVDCLFLELDRRFHFHFFDVQHGGDAILWQHLFWFFGHPWVYVIFLPATGMISMLLPVFARRPIVGYPFVALATVVTGFVGFGVWVHHMFAVGMTQLSMSFFSAASMTISIASTVQVFAWTATLWRGRPVMTTSMWFAVGFLISLVIGGLSGVITAVVPFDWQVHDTYFVVAHLHYVLVGANMLPVFAALYYWFPKITGRMNDERLGKISFALIFTGFNVTFFPMHFAGALGMPRRVFTYSGAQGIEGLNLAASIGAAILTAGIAVSLWNFIRSMMSGTTPRASDNPWKADTLEWDTTSPPLVFGSEHIPQVITRHPLWDDFDEEHDPHEQRALDGARVTFSTSALDAQIVGIARMPSDTLAPLFFSLALTGVFVALVLASKWCIPLAALTAATMAWWFWPKPLRTTDIPLTDEEQARRGPPLTTVVDHKRGAWGMWLFIATEAMLFAMFFFAYFYLGPWHAEKPPELKLALVMLAILLSSSALVFVAEHFGGPFARVLFALAAVLGIAFVGVQALEYAHHMKELTPQMGSYGSIFYTITGVHGAHVALGVLFLVYALVQPAASLAPTLKNAARYWHFVDLVWVVIVAALYVMPNLRGFP